MALLYCNCLIRLINLNFHSYRRIPIIYGHHSFYIAGKISYFFLFFWPGSTLGQILSEKSSFSEAISEISVSKSSLFAVLALLDVLLLFASRYQISLGYTSLF